LFFAYTVLLTDKFKFNILFKGKDSCRCTEQLQKIKSDMIDELKGGCSTNAKGELKKKQVYELT